MSSSSSETEEFYDALEITPIKSPKRKTSKHVPEAEVPEIEIDKTNEAPVEVKDDQLQDSCKKEEKVTGDDDEGAAASETEIPVPKIENAEFQKLDFEQKAIEGEKRRKRLKELRRKMQTDDEEPGSGSPPGSGSSSIEATYAATKTLHPFKVIQPDSVSLQSAMSLGKIGLILSGSETLSSRDHSTSSVNLSEREVTPSHSVERIDESPSTEQELKVDSPEDQSASQSSSDLAQSLSDQNQLSSLLPTPLQEPDVIASTKSAIQVPDQPPVAPPRRRRKHKPPPPGTSVPLVARSSATLPSPASTIESLTKELEHSLDIKSAIKGQYVVKPQDEEKTKAEGPSLESDEGGSMVPVDAGVLESFDEEDDGVMRKISPKVIIDEAKFSPQKSPISDKDRELEHQLSNLNMVIRTHSDSGKPLTDMEILEQVTVLNLDTGERVPLSVAEDKLPQGINPLSLHIMRLTSEYVSNSSLDREQESDEESVDIKVKGSLPAGEEGEQEEQVVKKKRSQLRKFLGTTVKKTMDKAKSIAHEVSHARHKEQDFDITDETISGETLGLQPLKLKVSSSHKGPCEFNNLTFIQDLSGEHMGPVWCMKFSPCGRLLATAGQDHILRVWVLRDAFPYFLDMRTKYNSEKVSPTPSQESLVSQHSSDDPPLMAEVEKEESNKAPFISKPFCRYKGHIADLLDVSWSKNYFILSSSMDKTVRLWHISRKECLCCFQHIDFVTAIAFHPRDDRYFISGSLDGKLRLWNIPDKKVALWNELDGQTKLITSANFCQNGKFAVVGTYDGRCIFYRTDQLKYHTQIHVRSSRGKNAKGRKITGIEPMPGEDRILITSNDSRIRLYDRRDLNLTCKYKGYVNLSSQIRAHFSHDGKYIISGSENQCVYIWKTHHDYSKFSSARRDRNDFWEGIKAHNAVVTCAIFAPHPDLVLKQIEKYSEKTDNVEEDASVLPQQATGSSGYVVVSADFNGCIKVFMNRTKPKHSSLPASAMA